MIYSELVRLRIEPNILRTLPIYNKGLDRILHSYDKYKKEIVVQYTGYDTNQYYPVHRETIDNELSKISKFICQDGVKKQKNETPDKLGTLEILVDHPAYNNRERHAIRNHFKNVREIRVPIPKIEEINRHYKQVYNKELTEIKDIKENPRTGERSGIVECGIIEDGNDIRSI